MDDMISEPDLRAAVAAADADSKRAKRKFTAEEDTLVRQLVDQHGTRQWDVVARSLPNRSARQVRDRWKHYLSPQVSLRQWTVEEDRLLLHLGAQIGPQWSTLVKFFPGRTDVSLKNRWNKFQRRSRKLAVVAAAARARQMPMGAPPVQATGE
jgi:hypothetical protein